MSLEQTSFDPDHHPIFAENEPITKYSARVLRKQLRAGGHHMDKGERQAIREVLDHGNLMDDGSFHILLEVLLNGNA